jgi:hypothetical protein
VADHVRAAVLEPPIAGYNAGDLPPTTPEEPMTTPERSSSDDAEQRRTTEEPGIDYATDATAFDDAAALSDEADPADILEQRRDDGPPDEDEAPETD